MKKLLPFFAVLFVCGPVFGVSVSGSDLVKYYESDKGSFNRGVFGGFVIGIADTWENISHPTIGTCFYRPENSTNGQLQEVVIKWLRNHPEDWHFSGESLVQIALAESFPCK